MSVRAILNSVGGGDVELPEGILTQDQKNIANGIAGLDEEGKIDQTQIPNDIIASISSATESALSASTTAQTAMSLFSEIVTQLPTVAMETSTFTGTGVQETKTFTVNGKPLAIFISGENQPGNYTYRSFRGSTQCLYSYNSGIGVVTWNNSTITISNIAWANNQIYNYTILYQPSSSFQTMNVTVKDTNNNLLPNVTIAGLYGEDGNEAVTNSNGVATGSALVGSNISLYNEYYDLDDNGGTQIVEKNTDITITVTPKVYNNTQKTITTAQQLYFMYNHTLSTVKICGGGGGGAGGSGSLSPSGSGGHGGAGGGGAGFTTISSLAIIAQQKYPIVIGAGGAGGSGGNGSNLGNLNYTIGSKGYAGGTTIAFGYSASGAAGAYIDSSFYITQPGAGSNGGGNGGSAGSPGTASTYGYGGGGGRGGTPTSAGTAGPRGVNAPASAGNNGSDGYSIGCGGQGGYGAGGDESTFYKGGRGGNGANGGVTFIIVS